MKTRFPLVLILVFLFNLGSRAQQHSFVQEDLILIPGVTTGAQVHNLGTGQRITTRTYFDGYGRPIQQIGMGSSPLQKDIIQPMRYDSLGRQPIAYLPYAASNNSGTFRSSALTEQSAFYTVTGQKYATDSKPYAQQIFENSPLQRIMQSGSVGEGFQPGQHHASMSYGTNTASETIRRWHPDGSPAANYATASLSVSSSANTEGNQLISYTDNQGKQVLKKQYLNEGGRTYLETYYVYDELGQLAYIIPPKAVKAMEDAGNYSLLQPQIAKLIFSYSYDHKGRNVEKTVPGSGMIYLIYDPLDRLVLAQDANMRTANQWNYIKYDSRQRPIAQGIYSNTTHVGRTAMQAYVNGLDYTSNYFENRHDSSANGYYTNHSFPHTEISPLAYGYFDDYDLDGNGSPDFTYQGQGMQGEATPAQYTDGQPTIIRKRSLGSGLADIWLTSVTFYDEKGRSIQTLSNNQLNTSVASIQTSVIDFVGRTTKTKSILVTSATLTVSRSFGYDHVGRIKTVDEQYNGGSTLRIANYEYNELGQLVDKKLHSTNGGASFLQSVDYRYTLQGQLRSINNSTLSADDDNDDTNDVFGMEMLYHTTDAGLGNTAYYNGQVSAVKWKTNAPGVATADQRSYVFGYDRSGRLKAANYADRNGMGSWGNHGAFDERDIGYDENGNITALKRNAILNGTATAVDDLAYSYNGNQLSNVTDGNGGSYGFFGFRNLTGSAQEYAYDSNGNLKTDPKKGLSLTYNILNRTQRITITTATNRYIDYTYASDGSLLRKQAYDGGTLQKTTDYIGGFVYENTTLAYFAMSEGRVRNSGGNLVNEYIITDQQGNARVSFEDNGGTALVRQENSYYPFGLTMPGSTIPSAANKNLYNGGAEWQDDFADLPDLQQTFYRMYDAALGRFIGVDPVAEAAHDMTTYQYALNDPILLNDPLGDQVDPVSGPYADFWNKALSYTTTYGASYNGSTQSWNIFHSNEEGFYAGAERMQANGMWGLYDGWANSYLEAAGNFNSFGSGAVSTTVGPGGYVTAGIFYRDAGGNPTTINGMSGHFTSYKVAGPNSGSPLGESMASKALDIATDFIPLVGSGKDIYRGIRDGNIAQTAMGVIGLVADIGSLGTSSLLKGAVKTAGKQLLREAAKQGFGSMMEAGEAARYAKYWERYAPKQINPGTTRMDWLRVSGRTGRMESSRVIYDNYGRQIYRVDFSNHMRPLNHSVPHLHQYQYGPMSSFGKESVFNFFRQ